MREPGSRFVIALSFPGEHRGFVAGVADSLADSLSKDRVLYDRYHETEFARPNLDTYLQHLYRYESELIVVFLCREYEGKDWCGLEFRAVRDLIKERQDSAIMFFRFDESPVSGVFGIDGCIPIQDRSPHEVAALILTRLDRNRGAG